MEIIVKDSMKLSQIQKVFNDYFPYLKIVFFNFNPLKEKIFLKENIIEDNDKTLSEIRKINTTDIIKVDRWQTVSSFEKQFIENFGVYAQVFRKSANVWLLTEATDEWVLSEQNLRGKEMAQKMKIEKTEDFDSYHEQL